MKHGIDSTGKYISQGAERASRDKKQTGAEFDEILRRAVEFCERWRAQSGYKRTEAVWWLRRLKCWEKKQWRCFHTCLFAPGSICNIRAGNHKGEEWNCVIWGGGYCGLNMEGKENNCKGRIGWLVKASVQKGKNKEASRLYILVRGRKFLFLYQIVSSSACGHNISVPGNVLSHISTGDFSLKALVPLTRSVICNNNWRRVSCRLVQWVI